jgi:16S rRNA (guanine527-N7)-methyltransferase
MTSVELTPDRLSVLLSPYVPGVELGRVLPFIRRYLELLQRWNARTNLTAIRDPEQMARRHVGESLAVAEYLRERFALEGRTLFDFGSGAGVPGVSIALLCPELSVTLIEAQNKKATFLKEVVRALGLRNCTIFAGRAEALGKQADFVTMRAVDQSETMTIVASSLLVPRGTLLRMVSAEQAEKAAADGKPVEYLAGGVCLVLQERS